MWLVDCGSSLCIGGEVMCGRVSVELGIGLCMGVDLFGWGVGLYTCAVDCLWICVWWIVVGIYLSLYPVTCW